MDDSHRTSLVIKGIGGITDSQYTYQSLPDTTNVRVKNLNERFKLKKKKASL